jgi:ribosomal protein S14
MNNTKYIHTLIDNKEYILRFSKCNICPYFSVEEEKIVGICKKIKEGENFKYIQTEVDFNLIKIKRTKHFISEQNINIPNWCELSSTPIFYNDNDNVYLYYKSENKVIKRKFYNFYILKNIQVVDESKVYNNDYDFKLSFIEEEKDNNNKKSKKQYICSSCGEKKKGISRYYNLGMCLDCWNKHNNDFNKKYISYINNFRLKRKSYYLNAEFKIINDKNI